MICSWDEGITTQVHQDEANVRSIFVSISTHQENSANANLDEDIHLFFAKKNKTKMSKSHVVTSANKLTTTTKIICELTNFEVFLKTQTPANSSGLISIWQHPSWCVPLLPGSSRQPIFVSLPSTLFIGFFGILHARKLTLVSSWMVENCKTQIMLIYSMLHHQWQTLNVKNS